MQQLDVLQESEQHGVLVNVVCFKEEEVYVTVRGSTKVEGLLAAILFRSAFCVDSLAMLLLSACSGSMSDDGYNAQDETG